MRTQADLRVVHITVSPDFLTKQAKWYQVPDRKPFFRVEVKEKIAIAPFLDATDSPTTAARQLNRHLAQVLASSPGVSNPNCSGRAPVRTTAGSPSSAARTRCAASVSPSC